MRYIEDLKEMLCDELDKIASKGELTAGTLDTVQKLTHSLKSVETIMAMEGYGDSYDDWSYEDGSYERGGNRGGGNRRSGRGRERDSMGRYTSRSYARDGRGRPRRMYSGDDMEKLTEMMNEVEDPKVRQALQKALDKMEE
jgi:hypothetical protein